MCCWLSPRPIRSGFHGRKKIPANKTKADNLLYFLPPRPCASARDLDSAFRTLLRLRALVSLTRYCATLRLPALGYTVDSFAPAQLALRANLRLVYLAPALALDCLSLWTCTIARVFTLARQTPLRA